MVELLLKMKAGLDNILAAAFQKNEAYANSLKARVQGWVLGSEGIYDTDGHWQLVSLRQIAQWQACTCIWICAQAHKHAYGDALCLQVVHIPTILDRLTMHTQLF